MVGAALQEKSLRAVYLPELISQENYSLTGEILHHLVQVVRIEKDEELLLLNGEGLSVKTIVTEASKRNLTLKRISENFVERSFQLDLALGIPKKDALDLCLKEAVELGFRKIYLIRGEFSQNKIPEAERLKNLLISALEQSNSPYMPLIEEATWQTVSWNDYGTVLHLDSQRENKSSSGNISRENLLVVGPEGGFSEKELDLLRALPQGESLHFPTPILRTPTAVAAGAGVVLQRLML